MIHYFVGHKSKCRSATDPITGRQIPPSIQPWMILCGSAGCATDDYVDKEFPELIKIRNRLNETLPDPEPQLFTNFIVLHTVDTATTWGNGVPTTRREPAELSYPNFTTLSVEEGEDRAPPLAAVLHELYQTSPAVRPKPPAPPPPPPAPDPAVIARTQLARMLCFNLPAMRTAKDSATNRRLQQLGLPPEEFDQMTPLACVDALIDALEAMGFKRH